MYHPILYFTASYAKLILQYICRRYLPFADLLEDVKDRSFPIDSDTRPAEVFAYLLSEWFIEAKTSRVIAITEAGESVCYWSPNMLHNIM